MKSTLVIFACVLASMTISAQEGTTVEDIQDSGCLGMTRGDGSEQIPTIVLTKEGSVMSVQLLNYESNCGTVDFNVTSAVSGGSDGVPYSVNISVIPNVPFEAARCYCLFNVSFTVRDVEANSFYLSCWWYKGLVELTEGEPLVLEYKVEDVTIDDISFKLLRVMHKAMLMDWTTTAEEVHIPSEVNYDSETYTVMGISKDAFWNVDQMTKVTLPKSIRSMDLDIENAIWANPFRECNSLEWIEVEEGCPLFSSVDGVLFAEDKRMLLGYPIASPRETYIVPEGVTNIRSGAFVHNKYLRKLVIPEEVTNLGWHLFDDMKSLEELYIKGILDPNCMRDLFGGMDTKVAVYVQPSELEKFQAIYRGKVYPLPDNDQYRPLVEEGKHWTYYNYLPVRPDEYNHGYSYDLKGDTLIAGKNCLKMYSDNRYNDGVVRYEAALYEENKKVFCFFPEKEEAVLLYDFDCEVGDTLNVYEAQMVVTDIQPAITGDVLIRKYTLQPVWDEPEDYGEIIWMEGVGATMDFFAMVPSDGNYNSLHACELNGEKLYQQARQDLTEKGYHRMAIEGKRWNYIRFYLDENGEHREPYSYVVKGDTIIGRTTYKKLWYQDATKERLECLLYEKGRTVYKITDPGININGQPVLTVFFNFGRNDFGRVFTWEAEMGARNTNWMVYGVDTIEVKNRQFRRYTCLQKYSEEGESLTTIDYHDESVWRDIWVEGVGSASSGIEDQFPPAEPSIRLPGVYTYFVSCEENGECIFTADDFNVQSGEESPYRPFVEEGKVWKVGDYSGNPVRRVEYFYFDSDTIIDGKACKQMMCQRYVSPEHPDYSVFSQFPSQSYIGAWYEEDKKVYKYDPTDKEFQLMYDFSLDANDTLWIKNASLPYIVGPRRTGGFKGFKGVYREVMQCYDENPCYNTTWLEGVGDVDGPILNVYYGEEDHAVFLMSCSVEDEVIYLNDEVEDGATPGENDAQKRRFDFTHTIKTKPKSPMKRESEQSLYGEYNELQLNINLDPIFDAYQVRIADETGNVVYEKAIDAAGIVGLNIDISAYEKGLYTVAVENDQEAFTGVFEVQTTSLSPLLQEESVETIYNLLGQRMSSLRKGLNIVNGRKVYVP